MTAARLPAPDPATMLPDRLGRVLAQPDASAALTSRPARAALRTAARFHRRLAADGDTTGYLTGRAGGERRRLEPTASQLLPPATTVLTDALADAAPLDLPDPHRPGAPPAMAAAPAGGITAANPTRARGGTVAGRPLPGPVPAGLGRSR